MRRVNNRKSNIALRVAEALFLIFMISCCIVPGIFAKYTSSTDGSSIGRVAKFDVAISKNPETMQFNGQDFFEDAESQQYALTVTSNSEVSFTYKVRLSFENIPPHYIKIWIDSNEKLSCDGETNEFELGTFTYNVGEVSKIHIINIQVDYTDVDADYSTFSNVPVTINVIADQVD